MRLSNITCMITFLVFFSGCSFAEAPLTVPEGMPVARPQGLVTNERATFVGGNVTMLVADYGPGPTYVALHANEQTSISAAQALVPNSGGRLIILQHTADRLISFNLEGQTYMFDPNRMFSDAGIRATLQRYGPYSEAAHREVSDLATAVLREMQGSYIVALHNNTDGAYSLLSYLSGGQYANEAAAVNQASNIDPDNFFFTTSQAWYDRLVQMGQNVVLQSAGATDDGSLSVFAGRLNIPYVNVEVQHGDFRAQQQMLGLMLSQ